MLTIAQQKKLLNALPATRINACKRHVRTCQMRGDGFMDILKSIGKVLGPIALELAPPVLKGFLKKLIPGSGLSLAGGSGRLTIAQQKKLLNALPATRINACKRHVRTCQMRGDGFMDILKSIGKVLGPIALELAPPVLKGFLKKLIPGSGLSLAGSCGGSLRLAGQGKRSQFEKGLRRFYRIRN